jgi:hypothetical protein
MVRRLGKIGEYAAYFIGNNLAELPCRAGAGAVLGRAAGAASGAAGKTRSGKTRRTRSAQPAVRPATASGAG